MSVESLFLEFSVGKLRQFAGRIEVCLGKLNEDQIWARSSENENAIVEQATAIIASLTNN